MKKEWEKLCRQIGYKFKNPSILSQALTHKSFLTSEKNDNSLYNERFEFLGDAIIDFIISEILMETYPKLDEGLLSKYRASLVSESGLKKQALELDLGNCLLIGRGEEITGGRTKPSLLANTFEALIAAIYIDSREKYGIKKVSNVIHNLFIKHIPKDAKSFITRDFKTELQELVQKNFGIPSTYKLIDEKGPDHEKEFTMAVFVKEREFGRGNGASKKIASQIAAKEALKKMTNESLISEI
tara:strand:- start:686 stop:1411 length:726 start_codon:yes stop_codon:yes gene_type:complete